MGRKFGVSKATVHRNLRKLGVTHYKKRTVPKYTNKQLQEIPKKCRILRRNFFNDPEKFIILDDEKYFTFSWSQSFINDGFYTNNINNVPDEIRFNKKAKFEQKVLVWVAISSKGLSQLYIHRTKGIAVNKTVYVKNCLTKLVKFVKTNHKEDKTIFWPDLASSHYAKDALQLLEKYNIDYVQSSQ